MYNGAKEKQVDINRSEVKSLPLYAGSPPRGVKKETSPIEPLNKLKRVWEFALRRQIRWWTARLYSTQSLLLSIEDTIKVPNVIGILFITQRIAQSKNLLIS
jgi:hypothetical protein